MPQPTLIWAALAISTLIAPARGQQVVVERLSREIELVEVGSDRWYELHFQLVEAELRSDVRAAAERAQRGFARAGPDVDPALRSSLGSLAALARTMADGPARAGSMAAGEPQLADAPPEWRARYFIYLSRRMCLAGEPSGELAAALDGLAAARAGGSISARVQATFLAHHVTRDSTETFERVLRTELTQLLQAPELSFLRPQLMLLEDERNRGEYSFEECAARLAEIEALANDLGDLATLGMVQIYAADLAAAMGDPARAFDCFETAAGLFELQQSPADQALALELACDLATVQGEFERAAGFLEAAEELVEGRGFSEREGGLLESRMGLALARGDDLVPRELRDAYQDNALRDDVKQREYLVLRDKLLSSERRRLESEEALAAGRAELTERLERAESLGMLGAVLALAALVAFLLHSRRRLSLVFERLRREVDRAEREEKERRSLEERIRQLQGTESLGLFASGIAHDFNNLTVVLLGNAELMLLGEQEPERRKQLEAIIAAGKRAASLCTQLQAFAEDSPLAVEPLDLPRVLTALESVLASAVGEQARVDLRLHEPVASIEGDQVQIEQAVLNLVINARDAGAREITIRTHPMRMTEADLDHGTFRGEVKPGEFACIEVRDDGEGMRPERVERIFDPFYTTRFPGRGLGLAGVLGIVRRHHGMLSVTSESGGGSCFQLILPLPSGPLPSGPLPTPAQPNATLEHAEPEIWRALDVLVIDDEPAVRAFLAAALAARGHQVHAIDDDTAKEEGFGEFESPTAAVVLLDLTMPAIDGRHVAAVLKDRFPAVPVILMSGQSATELEDTARELGVKGSLAKPFSIRQLEAALLQAVGTQVDGSARTI